MKLPIYFDYHATTPVDHEVAQAMLPYFTEVFGNASSRHHEFGWRAEAAVEKARERIARFIGATPHEIIFTSGATESNNLALSGLAQNHPGAHFITTAAEHLSILEPLEKLKQQGCEVTVLPVDSTGRVSAQQVADAIRPNTKLVSVIYGNNEIGSLNPIAEIGKVCRERGVLFHTDAVQVLGKLPIQVDELNADLLTLNAHKIYGPKGIGALYARRKKPRVSLEPQQLGGGHERGIRSGTLNVPGVVGFGKAVELAQKLMPTEIPRIERLRDHLWQGLQVGLDELSLNGHLSERLPNLLNIVFTYVEGESLMIALKEFAVSSGSACSTEQKLPSHVLQAIGLSDEQSRSSIRIGVGRFTTEEEIDFAIKRITESVRELRRLSPLYPGSEHFSGEKGNHSDVLEECST